MEPRLRIRYSSEDYSVWLDELSALLGAIENTGSLNSAAQRLGIPYRRSWQILRDAAKLLGYPLTATETGGAAGGGSKLTESARDLRGLLERLLYNLDGEGHRLRVIPRKKGASKDSFDLPVEPDLLLASSTEPVESGLLNKLEVAFCEETGFRVRHLSLGSSEALSLVVSGRVDAAISHAPALEEELHRRGLARRRRPFMMSHFAVVATREDPAHLQEVPGGSLLDYFSRIEATGTPFVSRADRSGTHLRELEVWKRLDGALPDGSWYRSESPVPGTREAINSAMAAGGYTLADRLAVHKRRGLRLFLAADEISENIYSFVVPGIATPGRKAADALATWLASPRARELVESAGVTPL